MPVLVTDRLDRVVPGVASAVDDGTTCDAGDISVAMSLKISLALNGVKLSWSRLGLSMRGGWD